MKVGILTFHSQLNYGGVLQCWALQQYIKSLGYDVVVLDRWMDCKNRLLLGPMASWNPLTWFDLIAKSLLGSGGLHYLVRCIKTYRFITRNLNLTKYHFFNWGDIRRNLGVDVVVVGSDQIWHGGDWGWPDVYLLNGAPKVRAIAYAASFGMMDVPDKLKDLYCRGFERFGRISLREKDGIDIMKKCGASEHIVNNVMHVVDPTLLIDKSDWDRLIGRAPRKHRKHLICYFISSGLTSSIKVLMKTARRYGVKVTIFVNDCRTRPSWKLRARSFMKYVNRTASPVEFVCAFANADYVVSDSFHAMMFATINNANIRFIKPQDVSRVKMFSRVEEFANNYLKGNPFVDSVKDAIESLFVRNENVLVNNEYLNSARISSRQWLLNALVDSNKKNEGIDE